MREIFFIRERCVDCGACSTACVTEHRKNHPVYDTLTILPMGRKRRSDMYRHSLADPVPHPVRCLHCEDPACMEACISGAIGVADRVYTRWERCVGCFMCVMNCPYGAILSFHNKALRCDECQFTEKPACVRACPNNALCFMEMDEFLQIRDKGRWRLRNHTREAPLLKARD